MWGKPGTARMVNDEKCSAFSAPFCVARRNKRSKGKIQEIKKPTHKYWLAIFSNELWLRRGSLSGWKRGWKGGLKQLSGAECREKKFSRGSMVGRVANRKVFEGSWANSFIETDISICQESERTNRGNRENVEGKADRLWGANRRGGYFRWRIIILVLGIRDLKSCPSSGLETYFRGSRTNRGFKAHIIVPYSMKKYIPLISVAPIGLNY